MNIKKNIFLFLLRCYNGFKVPLALGRAMNRYEEDIFNSGTLSLRETYFNKIKNEVYNIGNLLKMPEFGKTLEIIAKEGENAFYNGCLTDIIVDEIQTNGGIITKADLQSYECLVKEPITYTLKNKIKLNTVPGPSCGILLNFIIALLDGKYFKLF